MKKLLFTLSLLLLPLLASAHDIEIPNADGVTIYYNTSYSRPELQVTYRGDEFDSYSDEYTGNVVIPEIVTYLGVTYKVTSIMSSAFSACSGLTSITIPNSVEWIGLYAFAGCFGLTSVTIPDGVTIIDNDAFYLCTGLTSVTIGNGVTRIGGSAFEGCTALTSVTIGNSVTSISSYAFKDCSALTSVTIPNNVTSISSDAFYKCSRLTSIEVVAENTKYDSRNNCNAIIETESNTLVVGCGTTIIPNTVTSVGVNAFGGCSGLTSVTIPNSVTSIGVNAFDGCYGLTSVTIGNSVMRIGGHAFKDCSALTSITIPNSVTSIEWAAFEGANISTVISLIENPFKIYGKAIAGNSTFSLNTFNNATLYVPIGTINKYKSTEGWKDFDNIQEGSGPDTKVSAVSYDSKESIIYELNGVRQSKPKKGINIINGKKYVKK